jgi:iron-sulfur cluster repair protein YtfE (RIC family)
MNTTQLPDARETLNEIVQRHPEALPVLHRYGFDTCCGGALPLEEVARRHGVELEPLLRELRELRSE